MNYMAGLLLGIAIGLLIAFIVEAIPNGISRYKIQKDNERLREYPLTYKQFSTIISYSFKYKLWHGILEGIDDLVDFEAKSLRGCKREFKKAVNDYLKFKEMIK